MTNPLYLYVLGVLVAAAIYCIFKRVDRDFPPWSRKND